MMGNLMFCWKLKQFLLATLRTSRIIHLLHFNCGYEQSIKEVKEISSVSVIKDDDVDYLENLSSYMFIM